MGCVAAKMPRPHVALVPNRRNPDEVRAYLAELAKRIVRARESAKIETQAEFARRMSADRSSIERWEDGRGAPDAFNIVTIAKVTSVPIDWLLRGFVAPSWRPTFDAWVKTQPNLEARARIWLEALPLEGLKPRPSFYSLVLVAYEDHAEPARAIQIAEENLDADRELGQSP